MNKLIITKWNDRALTARFDEGECRALFLESEDRQSLLGNIYIGKVKNIVKNIGAAFIDLGGIMGYYSLADNPVPVYADGRKTGNALRPGDELIVQIARDAVKSKEPTLTCCLNFPGKYTVVTMGKTQLGFSGKIHDERWKEQVKERLQIFKNERYGIIVRTNAYGIDAEKIEEEVKQLSLHMESVLTRAKSRTCYSLIQSGNPSYIQSLRDTPQLKEIVTDIPEYWQQIKDYLEEKQPADQEKLILYDDPLLPLIKLCSLESVIKTAAGSRVWLRSGGYLVIEPTEALTVIDVNSGKFSGKKTQAETILKINLEAAKEAARQISLRNLSGIILIDFIDMEDESSRDELLSVLRREFMRDPVKTVLVDITKLGLVEITRKKVRKPWHEMVRE